MKAPSEETYIKRRFQLRRERQINLKGGESALRPEVLVLPEVILTVASSVQVVMLTDEAKRKHYGARNNERIERKRRFTERLLFLIFVYFCPGKWLRKQIESRSDYGYRELRKWWDPHTEKAYSKIEHDTNGPLWGGYCMRLREKVISIWQKRSAPSE